MSGAFYPPPRREPVAGGAYVAVVVVPVWQGQLVAFDVTAPGAEGRWFPWAPLPWGTEPWEAAASLAEEWCGADLAELRLVDALGGEGLGGSWQLTLVFRAELLGPPRTSAQRQPVLLPAQPAAPVGGFAPADVARWAAGPGPALSPPAAAEGPLLF
ncbi:MAG: hypothetical protein RMK15_04795 [Chloroflexota bacterium]|nr:hypothetical protein [Dehalococcoidia bacterium]MDW8046580.1 hypothetical protein [Chloroflexota bacterium]